MNGCGANDSKYDFDCVFLLQFLNYLISLSE